MSDTIESAPVEKKTRAEILAEREAKRPAAADRKVFGKRVDPSELPDDQRLYVFTDEETDTDYYVARDISMAVYMDYERVTSDRTDQAAMVSLLIGMLGPEAWRVAKSYGDEAVEDILDTLLDVVTAYGEAASSRGNRASRRSTSRGRARG